MKNFIKLFIVFFIALTNVKAGATHMAGAYITYRHLAADSYRVKAVFIRDCNGISFNNPTFGVMFGSASSLNLGGNYSLSLTRKRIYKARTQCPKNMDLTCLNENTAFQGEGYEIHEYETTVHLNKAPFLVPMGVSSFDRITFYAGQCCRNSKITTGMAGDDFFVTSQFIYKVNGNRIDNSSPSIDVSKTSNFLACCNRPITLGPLIYDYIDYDSFSVELVPAISALPNTSVTYTSPFTYKNPATPFCIPPTSIICTPDITSNPPKGFHFNSTTGQVILTPTNCNETFVIARRINEYRKIGGNMVLVGSHVVDCQTIVRDNCGYNRFIIPRIAGGIDTIKAGDTFTLQLNSEDPVFMPHQTIPDTTSFTIAYVPKGVTLTRKVPFNREDTSYLEWVPRKSQAGKTHIIHVEYSDNHCTGYSVASVTKRVFVYTGINTIKVRPFDDKNENGIKDIGEVYLENVQFYYGHGQQENIISSNDTGMAEFKVYAKSQLKFKMAYSDIFTLTKPIPSQVYFEFDTIRSIHVPIKVNGHVKGRLYADIDSSCSLAGAKEYLGRFATIKMGARKAVANYDGTFMILLDSSRNYSIGLDKYLDTAVCNTSRTLSSTFYKKDSVYNLGNIPVSGFDELGLKLKTSRIRRGREFYLYVDVTNYSRFDLSKWFKKPVRIYVRIPDRYITYKSAEYPLTYDNIKKAYYFEITEISGQRSLSNGILFNLDTAGTKVGQTLTFKTKLDTSFSDLEIANNSAQLKSIISGPYDPNEKLSLSGYTVFNKTDIIYRINYQNLGGDTAFNVIVKDELDDAFDLNTFEFLDSKIPAEVSIKDREISFVLRNHFLPPKAISDTASCGFVKFKVNLKSSLNKAYNISNEANIYFDFEAPVKTAPCIIEHANFTEIIELGKASYCQNEEVEITYLCRAINSSGSLAIELSDKTGSNFSPIGKVWVHDVLDDTGLIRVLLPKEIEGSSNYRLRIVPTDFSSSLTKPSIAFKIADRIVIGKLEDDVYCNQQAVKVELKNSDLFDVFLNDIQIKTKVSAGIISLGLLKQNDSIEVRSMLPSGCMLTNTLKPEIKKFKTYFSFDKIDYCEKEPMKITVSGYDKFDVSKNGIWILKNRNIGNHGLGNAGLMKDSFEIYSFNTSNKCRDTNYVRLIHNTLPKFTASLVKDSLCRDLPEVKITNNYEYDLYRDYTLISNKVKAGIYPQTKNASISFGVVAKSKDGCIDSVKINPAYIEADLSPVISLEVPDPLCESDKVDIELMNLDQAELFANKVFKANLKKNVKYSLLSNGTLSQSIYLVKKGVLDCIYKTDDFDLAYQPEVKPNIFLRGDTLLTSKFISYQWYTKDGNITGTEDTLQNFVPSSSGEYYVVAKSSFYCVLPSDVFQYSKSAIQKSNSKGKVAIMPNPFSNEVLIKRDFKIDEVVIYTIEGKRLFSRTPTNNRIDTRDIPSGIYVFELISKENVIKVPMTKSE